WPGPGSQPKPADYLLSAHVDLDEIASELAARKEIGGVRCEVHVVHAGTRNAKRVMELHRLGVTKGQRLHPLFDDDRVLPVRGEVEVVRVGDGDGSPGPAGRRIDRGEAVAQV